MSCWLCGFETTELVKNAKAPICENGPCQICSAVAKVDEEINQAVAALRRLIAKRCDLRSEQNRVHGILIHRFPMELKNYIFELLLPSRDEWGDLPHKERLVMPWFLGSVCRGWRDVAWSNPSLWSTIHIVLGSTPSSRISSVNDWVLRSQSLPLQIVLCGAGGSYKQLKDVLYAISRCSDRWHSLFLKMPWTLNACLPSNLHCQILKKLRIICKKELGEVTNQTRPLFLDTFSPEMISISGVALQSLQISWNHLTSVKVTDFDLEEITQVFQHASHMTHLQIRSSRFHTSLPPIIHRRLRIFTLSWGDQPFGTASLLGSLTLPSLQEFHTNAMDALTSLPALVQRSSCPLTKLRLFKYFEGEASILDNLPPIPGVTDLVMGALTCEPRMIKKLLLDGYFPDLRHLTLRMEPFRLLLETGAIIPLLGLKQSRPDRPNEGKLDKFLVIDQASYFVNLWNSSFGERMKTLNIIWMEDGFEILSCRTSMDHHQ